MLQLVVQGACWGSNTYLLYLYIFMVVFSNIVDKLDDTVFVFSEISNNLNDLLIMML